MAPSESSDRAAAFREHLETGDVTGARSVARDLDDRSVAELLDDVATALEEERDDDAATLLAALTDAYRAKRRAEARTVGSIEAARDAESASLQRVQELSDVLRFRMTVQLERAKVLNGIGAFVEAPRGVETPDRESVVSTVRETKRREGELSERATKVQETIDDITVPPSLRINSERDLAATIDTAESHTVSFDVLNVGDSRATSVTVSLSLPEWISAERDSRTVESIDPGDAVSVEFELVATEAGTDTVEARATTNDGRGDTKQFRVSAEGFPLGSPLERADRNDDWELSEAEINEAVREWNDGTYSTAELYRIFSQWSAE